jgi:ABC-type glycerol-3-phosphate transport system permease component
LPASRKNELLPSTRIIPTTRPPANYNYVFTGKIPTAYEVKGQLRSRISQKRLIPAALKNSFIVATSVMVINLAIGPIAAYTIAWQRFRQDNPAQFHPWQPPTRNGVAIPYYVIIEHWDSWTRTFHSS